MRRLVLAMPHLVVAQPHRQKKLRVDHRRPQLDVGVVFFEPPGVIAALENSALDRALKIDASIFVLARHPRDHAELEPAARARPRRDFHARDQRRLDQRRLARRAPNFVQFLVLRPDSRAIAGQPEQVFRRAQDAELVGRGREENRHSGAIGHHAPRDFARTRDASRDFAGRDRLEPRLRMRDVEIWPEAYRMRLRALGQRCLAIAPGISIRLPRAIHLPTVLLRA